MATDEQRKLVKIQNHLGFILRLARELRDEPMSVAKQAHAIERVEKHAQYAFSRFNDIVADNVGIIARMEIEHEPYNQPN